MSAEIAAGARRLRSIARSGAFFAAAALLIAGATVGMRWCAVSAKTEFFQNEDVAGITYNADLLRHGKTPYVDSAEPKDPASFIGLFWLWSIFGRSLFVMEWFGVVLSALTALGVFAVGTALYGRASGAMGGLLYAFWSPHIDSMTVNYNVWMMPAYVWATFALVIALRGGRAGWFVAAGFLATAASLAKKQAAMIAPILGIVVLLHPLLARPTHWSTPRSVRHALHYAAGVLLGFLPMVVFYASRGALRAFVDGYFFNRWIWEYAAALYGARESLERLRDGILGFAEYTSLPALLAVCTIAAAPQEGLRRWSLGGALLGIHLVLSFVGAGVGLRFYTGYYLQVLPALCWLAAHPRGPLVRWWSRAAWPRGLAPTAAAAALPLACALGLTPAFLHDLDKMTAEQSARAGVSGNKAEAIAIAKVIRQRTVEADTIWVWGRWAWPVYYHADRLAATRFYKVLGLVTNTLDNTWKKTMSPTHFVAQGPYREIADELRRGRPAFIVTANNESYTGWKALEELLRRDYVEVPGRRFSAFHVYYRFDLPSRPGLTPPGARI